MLWSYICKQIEKYPMQTVCEGKVNLTYEELRIFAEAFGSKLLNEKCCAIYCSSELGTAMALMSCFAAGVTAVPLSLRYGEAHCKKILDMVDPTCVITDLGGELIINHVMNSNYKKPIKHPVLIMCTSGTTGIPKGVMLSEKNIITNLCDISSYFKIDGTDTILIARPLYHSAVLTGEFLTALLKGTKIVFDSGRFNPASIIKSLYEQKITVFGGTPTLINLLSQLIRKKDGTYLKHIVISGECMSDAVGENITNSFPEAKIYHVYGLTEACPRVSYMPPESFRDNYSCVGVPLDSVQIKIVNDKGEKVKKGYKGILWIKGDNVMLGYYNAPNHTKRVLRNGWLCTGDIATITEGGWLKIYGRSDDMIIRAGMNIYPADIEAEIKKDSRTKEVIVYGIDEQAYGTCIGMDICGSFSSKNEIFELCKKNLPTYAVPSVIRLVDSLPKNASGKIERRKNVRI